MVKLVLWEHYSPVMPVCGNNIILTTVELACSYFHSFKWRKTFHLSKSTTTYPDNFSGILFWQKLPWTIYNIYSECMVVQGPFPNPEKIIACNHNYMIFSHFFFLRNGVFGTSLEKNPHASDFVCMSYMTIGTFYLSVTLSFFYPGLDTGPKSTRLLR